MSHIEKLVSQYELTENERYCLYVLRPDGWPWGDYGEYTFPRDVANTFAELSKRSDVIGLWITLEAFDGTKDITIFQEASRWTRRKRRIA